MQTYMVLVSVVIVLKNRKVMYVAQRVSLSEWKIEP